MFNCPRNRKWPEHTSTSLYSLKLLKFMNTEIGNIPYIQKNYLAGKLLVIITARTCHKSARVDFSIGDLYSDLFSCSKAC